MDCQAMEMHQIVALAQRRGAIGPPGSEMELIHIPITKYCQVLDGAFIPKSPFER